MRAVGIPPQGWLAPGLRIPPAAVGFGIVALAFGACLAVARPCAPSSSAFIGYGIFGTIVAAPFLLDPHASFRRGKFALFLSLLTVLWAIPLNTRIVFLRDLDRVRPGMTVGDVESIMGRYFEGTGWPPPPYEPIPEGWRFEESSGVTLNYAASIARDDRIQGSFVYRHRSRGALDGDRGVVEISKGRVVGTSFVPN